MIQYGCLFMMHVIFFHWMIKGMLKHWICLNIKTPKLLNNTLGFVLLWNLSYVNLIEVIYLGVVCSSHSSSLRKKKGATRLSITIPIFPCGPRTSLSFSVSLKIMKEPYRA